MIYAKPEVVLLANATQLIQGSSEKGQCTALDADQQHFNATASAYEADE